MLEHIASVRSIIIIVKFIEMVSVYAVVVLKLLMIDMNPSVDVPSDIRFSG